MELEEVKRKIDSYHQAGHSRKDTIAMISKIPIDGEVAEAFEYVDLVYKTEPDTPSANNYITLDKNGNPVLALAQLARDLLAEYNLATLRDTGELLIYQDGVYRYGGTQFVKAECQQRVGVNALLTEHKVNEIIGHINRSTYIDREMFNRDVWVINILNGLLDTRTQKLTPHTPEFLSTIRIPVEYNPDADCPRIKKFFSEVLKPEDILTIEEFFGYCLIPDYTMQVIPLFVGEGKEGKSTTLKLLEEFVGKDNCSHISWHKLERSRFSTAVLVGKLVNSFADLPSGNIAETGTFKMLSGGDSMDAEKKFHNPFSFTNFARLIFSTNKPPIVSDDSYAFWRRWMIINFPNQFIGEREDKEILQKIKTKEELSGLLNLALAGLGRLMKNQHYNYTKTVEETTETYLRAADPIYAFLKDKCEVDSKEWISKDDLYHYFTEYCQVKKTPLKKPNSFARGLQNQTYFRVSSVRQTKDGVQIPGWQGIKISEDSEDSEVISQLMQEQEQCNRGNKIGKNVTNPTNLSFSANPDNPDVGTPPSPNKPCPTCGFKDYWLRPASKLGSAEWICHNCHPDPPEGGNRQL